MLDAKFTITEETFTDYLTELHSNVHKSMEDFLKDNLGGIVVERITLNAPDWTSNLYMSGYEKDLWIVEKTPERTTLDILYTGMYYEEIIGEDEMKGWGEFGGSSTYPYEPPARDYAYFQETGIDAVADSDDAKHKYFVAKGVKDSQRLVLNSTKDFLEKMMKMK